MKPAEFIATIGPAAQASAAVTKVPASFVVAQAALESAWGKSALTTEGRNLFGVKADSSWHGPVLMLPTRECIKGAWCTVPATWRKYPNWRASIDDHAQFFINNPRYKPAFETTDGEAFAHAVAAAGYATDPQYADKVIAVMRQHKLGDLDK